MKTNIGILAIILLSWTFGYFTGRPLKSRSETPAIIYKARDGTILATATLSKDKSYIIGDLDSVTFTTNQFGGIKIITNP